MNSDFKDLLRILSEHDVRFLIVGGYALVEYTEPRFTKDLDIWIECSSENAPKVVSALRAFGAPLFGATEQDFATPGNVLQLGVAPSRIDILTAIDGVYFGEAWTRRTSTDFDGVRTHLISLPDLIKNKESTPRERDKLEAAMLKKVLEGRRQE